MRQLINKSIQGLVKAEILSEQLQAKVLAFTNKAAFAGLEKNLFYLQPTLNICNMDHLIQIEDLCVRALALSSLAMHTTPGKF